VPKVTTEICVLATKMSHLRRVNQNDLLASILFESLECESGGVKTLKYHKLISLFFPLTC
jgi:hypothetical protein